MPLYEYQCPACRREQELLLRIDHLTPCCPACHKKMRRKISRTNFALRGGGWARDGYGAGTGDNRASGSD